MTPKNKPPELPLQPGTRVRVTLPAKYSYLPLPATIISTTKDEKYVAFMDKPIHVEELGRILDIISVRPEKVKQERYGK